MCTVIGYQGNKDAKDILIQALQRTKSRGPDDQRIESFGYICGRCPFVNFLQRRNFRRGRHQHHFGGGNGTCGL